MKNKEHQIEYVNLFPGDIAFGEKKYKAEGYNRRDGYK